MENCGGIRGYEELITLKETGKIPDSTSWDDAANIIELMEEWNPEAFALDEAKATFDLPSKAEHQSA